MPPTMNTIFGEGEEEFSSLVARLEIEQSMASTRYSFCTLEEFDDLRLRGTGHVERVYWHELIGRAHLASISSIFRSGQWLRGTQLANEQGLYLPFCANLRCLIESAADSLTGLKGVAQTIAKHKTAINEALNMKARHTLISSELEDQLIHFSHGRKVVKGESPPRSHVARSAREYLETLEELGLTDSNRVYSELCQITHPASASVSHFLCRADDGGLFVISHNDNTAIANLVRDNVKFFASILKYAFNPPIILLRVLAHIDAPEYHSTEVVNLDLSSMPGWKRCADSMGIAP